jgi:hypothetical protein
MGSLNNTILSAEFMKGSFQLPSWGFGRLIERILATLLCWIRQAVSRASPEEARMCYSYLHN